MNKCTDPRGHKWLSESFEINAGSTPVKCERCEQVGFKLNPHKVPARNGRTV